MTLAKASLARSTRGLNACAENSEATEWRVRRCLRPGNRLLTNLPARLEKVLMAEMAGPNKQLDAPAGAHLTATARQTRLH
jgi:hypothetical protein